MRHATRPEPHEHRHTSTVTRPEHRRDTTAASRLEHRRNSTGSYAACIAGVARGMVAAWPSFLAYVEPHVAGVFINLAAHTDNCTRAILEHPKVIRWHSNNSFDRQHSSASRNAIQQHDMRERGCLKLIASQPVVYASVLLTRPDILYAEPFPFAHFPPTPSTLFIPFGDDHNNGINDQLAVGSLSALTRMTGWASVLPTGWANVLPEAALAAHINRTGLHVKRFWYEYAMLRPRDISIARAVGAETFVAFNHNTRIWQRFISNGRFDTGANAVDAKTQCTVTTAGHVELPSHIKCTRVPHALSCNRSAPADWARVACTAELSRSDAEAALCHRGDVVPQGKREVAFQESCPHLANAHCAQRPLNVPKIIPKNVTKTMRKEDERGREGRTLTPRDPANDRRLNASWRVRREGREGRVSSSRARLLPARLILQSLVALLVIMIFVLAILGMALGCFCTEER